jgi:phosphoserine phosphatase RsbU/P
VICVPLVRVRAGSVQDTVITSVNDTVGLLYLDSRRTAADLSAGNRELLQTLALEASTILENARLLEEEREKQRMEEELNVARQIQHGLLPSALPSSGWFRASGSSIPSRQVGGDYFDVRPIGEDRWVTVVADVSGKGVSSALLASLLQGAFLLASDSPIPMQEMMARVNHFLNERTGGEKYATVFYCTLSRDGVLRWVNTGHPKPVVVTRGGEMRQLASTGLPLGMLPESTYEVGETRLEPGEKMVLFSDGLSEAENADGEFFEKRELRSILRENAAEDCAGMRAALERAVEAFADISVPADDITVVVTEYLPQEL